MSTTEPMTTTAALLAEARALNAAATPGPWVVDVISDGWDGTTKVIAQDGPWRECNHFCEWPKEATSSRGQLHTPGHEHRSGLQICSGWGYDACGLTIEDTDAAFIARARTLLPQLADAYVALHAKVREKAIKARQ